MISFPSKVKAVKNVIRAKWTYSSKYTPIFIASYHPSTQQLSLSSLPTAILQDKFSFNLSLKSCSNAYPYSKSFPYKLPIIWTLLSGFLWTLKELNYQCSRQKRHRFYPWVGKNPLEECMATHSAILAWRIPWTEEPSGLQSVGLFIKSQKGLKWLSMHSITAWSRLLDCYFFCFTHCSNFDFCAQNTHFLVYKTIITF